MNIEYITGLYISEKASMLTKNCQRISHFDCKFITYPPSASAVRDLAGPSKWRLKRLSSALWYLGHRRCQTHLVIPHRNGNLMLH